MQIASLTIDDTLPFPEPRKALSLIRGITKIEIAERFDEINRQEYEPLKNAFLNNLKRSMSKYIDKIT